MAAAQDRMSPGVKRILARDDLLQLAYQSEAAVDVARAAARRRFEELDESNLYQTALDIHRRNAEEPGLGGYTRGQFLAYAGKIVEFCGVTGAPCESDKTAPQLFTMALEAISPMDGSRRKKLGREPTGAVITAQLAARSLRLAGRGDAAIDLVHRSEGYFYATGVEHLRAQYEYELSANLLVDGQARQVHHALSESDDHWQQGRAAATVDRHRYRFAVAIADHQLGNLDQAELSLQELLAELGTETGEEIDDWRDVCRLSVQLALAETLHLMERRKDDATKELDHALDLADDLRARWRVIARSHSPLSIALRRVWGDMALLAADSRAIDAPRLGAAIALSAKQSGFARFMRAERAEFASHPAVLGIIDELHDRELGRIEQALGSYNRESVEDEISQLRCELQIQVSSVLADFVLPERVEVGTISSVLGHRLALDFVFLPDSVGGRDADLNCFRAFYGHDGAVVFDQLDWKGKAHRFLDGDDTWTSRLDRVIAPGDPYWQEFGEVLLPLSLLEYLGSVDPDDPADLVISGHERLNHLPWMALKVNERSRLLDLAVITQTPALSCLSDSPSPDVCGPALVRLVATAVQTTDGYKPALDVGAECRAWDLPVPGRGDPVPLYRTSLAGEAATPLSSSLAEELSDVHVFRHVHVGAHGTGAGLAQQVWLPEPVGAGAALKVRWPPTVVMACCQLGRVENYAEVEPFGFVICLLSAGARCAVVGVDAIDDRGTSELAADMVKRMKQGPVRLERALRDAQRAASASPLSHWGLLATYVR